MVQKPDLGRSLNSGPPVRFAGACHPSALPPSHPSIAFCSTGGVVAHLGKFYSGSTDGEERISAPVSHYSFCMSSEWVPKVPISAARPLPYPPIFFCLWDIYM